MKSHSAMAPTLGLHIPGMFSVRPPVHHFCHNKQSPQPDPTRRPRPATRSTHSWYTSELEGWLLSNPKKDHSPNHEGNVTLVFTKKSISDATEILLEHLCIKMFIPRKLELKHVLQKFGPKDYTENNV